MCMCGNRTCMQEQIQILVYKMAAMQCLSKADTETASSSAKDYNLSIQIPPQYPISMQASYKKRYLLN